MAEQNARLTAAVQQASDAIRGIVHGLLDAAVQQARTEIDDALRATRPANEARRNAAPETAQTTARRRSRDRRSGGLLVDRVYNALPAGAGLSLDEICARRQLKGVAKNQIGLALSRLERSGRMRKDAAGTWHKLPAPSEAERQVA